jgi:hypothetical protein
MSPLATVAAKSGERIAPASLVGAPEPPASSAFLPLDDAGGSD